jgi:hypothetical protein
MRDKLTSRTFDAAVEPDKRLMQWLPLALPFVRIPPSHCCGLSNRQRNRCDLPLAARIIARRRATTRRVPLDPSWPLPAAARSKLLFVVSGATQKSPHALNTGSIVIGGRRIGRCAHVVAQLLYSSPARGHCVAHHAPHRQYIAIGRQGWANSRKRSPQCRFLCPFPVLKIVISYLGWLKWRTRKVSLPINAKITNTSNH